MLRRLTFVLMICLIAAPSLVSAQPAAAPVKAASAEGITEYQLANGLRVLLFPDPTKSNITVNVTYMVGSRHENYGETGMAHLLEHLLFKGSTNHPNIPKELTDHGTRPNGTTSFDRTNYFETFQATDENLKWALEMEADRMVNSFIAKKDLDSEFSVVRNEYESGENDPQGVLYKRVLSAAYQWHNYGNVVIGAKSDIERVPIDRLQAFYRHFYQPDNALLVVAGKIDEAKTLALIQQTFGAIPKPARELRRTYTSEPTQDGERLVTLRRVGDTQAVMAAYHVPPGSHEEYPAVAMASRIIGDVPSGRLHKALVESKKAAETTMGAFQLKEPGLAYAFAEVRMENSVEEAKQTLLDTIESIKQKPFTQEELDRIKAQATRNFELAMNNSERIALQLSEWQAQGDWRLMFLNRDRIEKVTLDQAQKAAEKYFIVSNRTAGVFIPDKTPVRAEVPEAPDVTSLVKDYKGRQAMTQGESFDASPANIDKRTVRADLAGGLKLAMIPKKTRGEQVNAVLTVRFGDEASLRGQRAVGGMAGQMLMRGTKNRTRQQIQDEITRLKSQISVFGGPTMAMASIQTTKANLPEALKLAAEILKEPTFPEAEFEQLKQQQLASIESSKSEPQALASIEMQRHLNPHSKDDVRYTPTLDEQLEELKAITLAQVKAFHAKYYGASHGEVTIVGDMDAETSQKLTSDLMNPWKSGAKYSRISDKYAPVPPLAKAIETPDKENSLWLASMKFPMKDTDADYPAMVLGNYILGSGLNSRLFARIRGKEGLSYGVGSRFNVDPLDGIGTFSGYAIAAPANAPKVEASFKDEMTKILAEGYTAAEVEAAKKSWLQSRQVSRANDRELVSRINSNLYLGRTMEFDKGIEEKVMALTPAQILAAMKKHLDLSKMSFVRAGDFKKANVAW